MGAIQLNATFDQFRITRLRHQLASHPLMTLDSLAALAMRLDMDFVHFHDGERALATKFSELMRTQTRDGLEMALQHLETRKTFVQIINVYSDPAYRALLDDVLDEVLPFLPARDRRLLNRDAAAFLASPESVTPFHMDHEQNFLCHISGPKTFYVWDQMDRSVVSERALELFYGDGKLREQIYEPLMQPKAQVFNLKPGDCVFIPMGAPHAANTGDGVTITFSVHMNTRTAMDRAEVHRVNHALRKMGFTPAPVGAHPVADSVKRGTFGALRQVRNLARGRVKREVHWY